MLSRVAENLYWMARYIERAEDTARLLSVNTHLMLDLPRHLPLGWAPLIEMTGTLDAFNARHASPGRSWPNRRGAYPGNSARDAARRFFSIVVFEAPLLAMP